MVLSMWVICHQCSSSVIHNDLVFIVYGAILRRYYKVIGYSTVEQPPKKDRKRQNEIKKGRKQSPAIPERASIRTSCLPLLIPNTLSLHGKMKIHLYL